MNIDQIEKFFLQLPSRMEEIQTQLGRMRSARQQATDRMQALSSDPVAEWLNQLEPSDAIESDWKTRFERYKQLFISLQTEIDNA
jgi:hypothetical protein